MAKSQGPTSGHLTLDPDDGQYKLSFPVTREFSCPFTMVPHEIVFTSKLSHPARTLWLALNTYADRNAECFPGMESLSVRMGISARRLRILRKELVSKGFLRVQKQFRNNGGQTSNRYTLLLPTLSPAKLGHDAPRSASMCRRVSKRRSTARNTLFRG